MSPFPWKTLTCRKRFHHLHSACSEAVISWMKDPSKKRPVLLHVGLITMRPESYTWMTWALPSCRNLALLHNCHYSHQTCRIHHFHPPPKKPHCVWAHELTHERQTDHTYDLYWVHFSRVTEYLQEPAEKQTGILDRTLTGGANDYRRSVLLRETLKVSRLQSNLLWNWTRWKQRRWGRRFLFLCLCACKK